MRVQSASIRRRPKMSDQVRDRIVLDHLPLVKAIAIRVHENLPVHVDLDDLIHAGVLGLFDAVIKFDDSKNVAFHSYAKHRIKGAILDSLRELDWASRDLRKRQKQVDAVTHELALKLGRNPSEAEVAQEMGISIERWHRMLLKGSQHPGGHRNNPVDIGIEPGNDRIQLRFLQGLIQVLPNAGVHKNITFPDARWDVRRLEC